MSDRAPARRRFRSAAATATAVAVTLTTAVLAVSSPADPAAQAATPGSSDSVADRANVVFVLVDDFSANLLPYLSEVQALADDGVTFENYFNATPWCCPSRATIQSGKYPHNTGVRSNTWPSGGFENFVDDVDTSLGTQLQANGYRTGLVGKYMNGLKVGGQQYPDRPSYPPDYVPPGWDTWFSGNTGYQHFAYQQVESVDNSPPTRLKWEGHKESNYYTDVLSGRAQDFIAKDSGDEPFFLMVSTYAPHKGLGPDPQGSEIKYPPAPRDRARSPDAPKTWSTPEFAEGDCGPVRCGDVPWPESSTPDNFNTVTANPLEWMPTEPLSPERVEQARGMHIQRIQMLQSVNDLLVDLRQALADSGHADDTYIMFGSDNGYHTGEHAMYAGKSTAYDHDIKVPFIVHPPGGTGGPAVTDAFVQNTDVLPTLVEIAGGTPGADVDGKSMLPLMSEPAQGWRAGALLELTNDGSSEDRANPDTQGSEGNNTAPTYNALRTANYLYVDYSEIDGKTPANHRAELYDLRVDPGQTVNIYRDLARRHRAALNAELVAQVACVGGECWQEQSSVPVIRLPASARQ